MNGRQTLTLLASALCLVGVGGCTQYTPSAMHDGKIGLASDVTMEQISADQLTDNHLSVLADHYARYGDGPLEVVVSYDPKSKRHTEAKAMYYARTIEQKLRQKGVRTVHSSVLPLIGEPPALMLSYPSLFARAPEGCDPMPGLEDPQTSRSLADYRFGCGTQSLIAKQVYRPADLRGRGTSDSGDGRRATNVVERYRIGEQLERLEGIEREDLTSQ